MKRLMRVVLAGRAARWAACISTVLVALACFAAQSDPAAPEPSAAAAPPGGAGTATSAAEPRARAEPVGSSSDVRGRDAASAQAADTRDAEAASRVHGAPAPRGDAEKPSAQAMPDASDADGSQQRIVAHRVNEPPPPHDAPVVRHEVLITDPDGTAHDGASAMAANYPDTLINEAGLVRLYTSADRWEVWICDVPNRNLGISLDETLDALNGPLRDGFTWLSDGQYDIDFVPGGVLRSAHHWDPGNVHTFQHRDCGGDPTCTDDSFGSPACLAYADRAGLPQITQWDDVTSNGIFVGFNRSQFTSPVSGIAGLYTDARCAALAGCDTSFPANQRAIYVDAAVLSPHTVYRRALTETAVHELGHAIEWPHSYWRTGYGEYHNNVDVMGGGPWRVATPVINRLGAGWIDDDDIATHLASSDAANYTLSPPGVSGLQAVTLPGSNATEYYIFGARSLQPNDWLYVRNGSYWDSPVVLAEGVEGYYIDQTCATQDSRSGICTGSAPSYGLRRRTEPVYPPNSSGAYTGHVLRVGQQVRANDLRVEVVDRKGLDWTVWVGDRFGPERPRSVQVTRDSATQLTVRWEPAPDKPDDAILASAAFDVEYRSGAGAWAGPTSGSGTCANSLPSSARSCTITGLTAGAAYDVRVRGVSAAPRSADGSWTPVGGAVRNPEVVAGAAELVVRWDPPAGGAGFSAAKHLVQISSGSGFAAPSAGSCSSSLGAGTTGCTITGLTNGTSYTARVAAVDGSGSGAWSAGVAATPSASLPAAPAAPAAVGSDGTVTLSWPATTDSSVTGHAVSYRTGTAAFAAPTAGTCSGVIVAAATSCTVTGLTNGAGYEFRRRLAASAGNGPWSLPAAATARAQPAAPTGVAVAAAWQALDVSWNAPSAADAPASTSARVEYAVTATEPVWRLGCAIADITVRACKIVSLVDSTGYSVRVRFSNGSDSAWTVATGTPAATAPVRLARPKVQADSDQSLKVTWTAPASAAQTGGSAVTGYRLEHRPYTSSAAAPWTTHVIAGSAASFVIDGLDAYRLYQVRVRAVNAHGAGPWSDPATGYISPLAAAAAPTAITAVVRGSSLDIGWTPPAAGTMLFYEMKLERRADTGSAWADQPFIGGCAALRAGTGACSITHYAAGQSFDASKQHRVSLRSRNHRGDSVYSPPVRAARAASGSTPSFGTDTIADQSWVTDSSVRTLHLPPAAGGTGALAYALSPALPAGLTFSPTDLTITGTPAAATAGAVAYTYTVTDSATPTPNTASLTFTVTVAADGAPVLAVIATVSVPTRRPIKTIQLPSVNPSSGNGVVAYSLRGTLPAGLTFDAAQRRIGGTPTLTAPGAVLPQTFDLVWTARDVDGDTYSVPFAVTVTEPPAQSASYPSQLIGQPERVRLYSAPHPDDAFTTDVWEVWVCDVPNGSLALTATGVATLLNDRISPYYRWLSGGKYRVSFVVGGTHAVSDNWTPASSSAMEHPGCGGASTPGTPFGDRPGIPQLVKDDEVSSNGMIVVYDRAVAAFADGLLLYDRCDSQTYLHMCPRSFPANERRIHLDGGVVATDSNGDPTARLRIAAHEIGQAIEFPHSFGANATDQHENLSDLLSGGAFPIGTTAANRYAAGWIADADVARHQSATGAATYTLAPVGVAGAQLLTLPGRDADEYYALGVRERSTNDALPTGRDGVEAYRVDHRPSRVHPAMACWTDVDTGGECYGRKRRHEPLAKAGADDTSYGHLYAVGDTGTVHDLRFQVLDRTGSTWTVWVGDKNAPDAPTAAAAHRTSEKQMSVSWAAPASGTAPTGYEVEFRTGTAAFAAPASGACSGTLGAGTRSCTVSGLVPDAPYDVRVRSASAHGNGPWSAQARAPAEPTPRAPTSLRLTAGHQHLGVSWAAPSPVQPPATTVQVQMRTGQHPFAAPSSGSCAGTVRVPTTSCGITGLANGAVYDVRARFSNGQYSPWTTASAAPTATAPDAPASPSLTSVGRTSLRASWSEPASNGSDISGYALQYRRAGTSAWTTHADAGVSLSRTIAGLATYVEYEVRVRATNGRGDSGWSTAARASPLATAVPGEPAAPAVSLTLTPQVGSPSLASLKIDWTAPPDSDVQSYTISLQSRADESAPWAAQAFMGDCASLGADDTSCTVTEYSSAQKLDPTRFHRAAVTAGNHLGTGPTSALSASSGSFLPPLAPTVTGIAHLSGTETRFTSAVVLPEGTLLVRWEMRTRAVLPDESAAPWTAYLEAVDGHGQAAASNPADLRTTSPGSDARFDVEVRAVNDIGQGAARRFRIRAGWPHRPRSFTAFAGQQQVTLRASVEQTGSEAVTAWQYKQWQGDDEPTGPWLHIGSASAYLDAPVTGLSAGEIYKFRVRAVSSAVAGVQSSVASAVPSRPPFVTSGDERDGSGPSGASPGGGGTGRAASIRLSGSTRYDTAAAVGNQHVTLLETADAATGVRASVDTLIVASGESFPDALAASALSRTLGAPVLLTGKRSLAFAVQAFITRHRIANVVIVGGPAAVSDDVSAAISALGGVQSVERIYGPDRFATAAAVAAAAGAPGRLCGSTRPTVIVTTGRNFPDALVAGPLAYRGRHPIVLTERDRLPAATAEYLRASGATQAVVIGGRAAVSDEVIGAIESLGMAAQRISGADRSDTSVRLARWLTGLVGTSGCFRKDSIGLATGWAFPDALAAAPLLGHYGAPLLLTSPRGVPQSLVGYAADGRLQPDFDLPPIITVGGRTAVPSNHATKLLANLPR